MGIMVIEKIFGLQYVHIIWMKIQYLENLFSNQFIAESLIQLVTNSISH